MSWYVRVFFCGTGCLPIFMVNISLSGKAKPMCRFTGVFSLRNVTSGVQGEETSREAGFGAVSLRRPSLSQEGVEAVYLLFVVVGSTGRPDRGCSPTM